MLRKISIVLNEKVYTFLHVSSIYDMTIRGTCIHG